MKTERVLRPFKLLRSFEEYQRWSNGNSRGHCGWNWSAGVDRELQRENLARCTPARFPCWAFVNVISMQYEEVEPFYLYQDVLRSMSASVEGQA